MVEQQMTAEQFAETRHELPDGGRWTELVHGVPHSQDPPDEIHGNVVLNLSKKLADVVQQHAANPPGYACFDLGLIVARQPDVVRFPAVSFFTEGNRFSMIDEIISELCPQLVMEIASSNLRRREMNQRIEEYHRFGVDQVWVLDTSETSLHICKPNASVQSFPGKEIFRDDSVLPDFELTVEKLFSPPDWWMDGKAN